MLVNNQTLCRNEHSEFSGIQYVCENEMILFQLAA